jgi:uncharacterized membrane protein YphA (DoxX/SURF4 family)
MKTATTIARILLGLIFLLTGLDGFIGFLPMPEPEGQAAAFMGILVESGWLLIIKTLEIVGGVLLLSGRWVPMGLVILGPVIVNIFIFHLLLDPSGLLVGIVLLAFLIFLIFAYRRHFAPLFAFKPRFEA